jgi:hypothetical protein
MSPSVEPKGRRVDVSRARLRPMNARARPLESEFLAFLSKALSFQASVDAHRHGSKA